MPWRFYRYMLVDVLRQFAITSVILVVVIAFGAALKPLSSDRLISGLDTLKYLVLAIVPMLQFALPFAAAFATSVGIHRLAQDNEITAMAVCGQSYRKLLLPIVFFGLILTVVISLLTQSVIPTFVGKMADAVTADIPKLLTNSIKQHTPFVQGNLIVWAEDIYVDTEHEGERMALDHVAVAKLDGDGRANMYLTAAAAGVDIQRRGDQTSLHVSTKDVAQWTRGDGGAGILRGAREGRMTHAIDLPTLSRHSPSYFTLGELLFLRTHPDAYQPVMRAIMNLRGQLIRKSFLDSMRSQFKVDHAIECTSVSGGRRFVIEAAGMEGVSFVPPVRVTAIRGSGESSVLSPAKTRLLIDQSETGEIESVTFHMFDVLVGAGQVGENQRGELIVPNLQVQEVHIDELKAYTITELLDIASTKKTKKIRHAAKNLKDSIAAMERQITSKIAQRWAVSAIPLFIVILSGLLAIRFSDRLPLVVYAKVFIPSVIALLLVFSGGQMVLDVKQISGFCVMWSGHVAVIVLIVFHWLRLRMT